MECTVLETEVAHEKMPFCLRRKTNPSSNHEFCCLFRQPATQNTAESQRRPNNTSHTLKKQPKITRLELHWYYLICLNCDKTHLHVIGGFSSQSLTKPISTFHGTKHMWDACLDELCQYVNVKGGVSPFHTVQGQKPAAFGWYGRTLNLHVFFNIDVPQLPSNICVPNLFSTKSTSLNLPNKTPACFGWVL